MTITLDDRAVDIIAAMQDQARGVTEAWKRHQPEWALRTATSLGFTLARLLNTGFGDSTLYRDGELGLLIDTGIQIGVVPFPIVRADHPLDTDPSFGITAPRMGRFCFTSEEVGYCTKPVINGTPTCEGHPPHIFSAPLPIEWSLHS